MLSMDDMEAVKLAPHPEDQFAGKRSSTSLTDSVLGAVFRESGVRLQQV